MTFDEIDLTNVPPAKLAKHAVFITLVQALKRLQGENPGVFQLFLNLHKTYSAVLGHRRLGRLYTLLADGKDPLAELLKEEPNENSDRSK